jgi:hypothetical protein
LLPVSLTAVVTRCLWHVDCRLHVSREVAAPDMERERSSNDIFDSCCNPVLVARRLG